jgi:hypothetical protein
MIGKLRALVSVLFACFAVGAVIAPAASAAVEFHSERERTEYWVEKSEGLMTFNNGQVLCTQQEFKGIIDSDSSSSNELMLTAEYECGGPLGTKAEVKMNGCEYRLDAIEKDPESYYVGLMDIECPSGKQIEINEVKGSELKCRVKLPGQKAMTKVTYLNANEGKGVERYIIAYWTLTGIKYTQEAGFGLGKCTAESASNGTYKSLFHILGVRPLSLEYFGVWIE